MIIFLKRFRNIKMMDEDCSFQIEWKRLCPFVTINREFEEFK